MFAYTSSYLETSISTQKSSEKDVKLSPKAIPAKKDERIS
jgi:hypothetical protein